MCQGERVYRWKEAGGPRLKKGAALMVLPLLIGGGLLGGYVLNRSGILSGDFVGGAVGEAVEDVVGLIPLVIEKTVPAVVNGVEAGIEATKESVSGSVSNVVKNLTILAITYTMVQALRSINRTP